MSEIVLSRGLEFVDRSQLVVRKDKGHGDKLNLL